VKKRVLATIAYMLPTFPLAYCWHLTTFAAYYKSLGVYRDDIIIPFGFLSMLIQGTIWALLYERLFAGQPVVKGAAKFAGIAVPLAWSLLVLAVSAKHIMTSVSQYLAIESAFIIVQYAIVSPLIAWVYSKPVQVERNAL